jgi:hypothetical protein
MESGCDIELIWMVGEFVREVMDVRELGRRCGRAEETDEGDMTQVGGADSVAIGVDTEVRGGVERRRDSSFREAWWSLQRVREALAGQGGMSLLGQHLQRFESQISSSLEIDS